MFGGFVAAVHKQEENSQSCPYRELFLVSSLPGFPGGSGSKEPACHAGDLASIPGSGSYPREGNGYPLQCSCLEWVAIPFSRIREWLPTPVFLPGESHE